jgi:sulfur carrier protein ThiS
MRTVIVPLIYHLIEVGMSVTVKFREDTYKVEAGMTVREAIKKLDISPESVLPTRNGELINDEDTLQEGDVIRLVAVISGG